MGFGLTAFGGGGTKNCGGGGSPTSFNRSGVGGGTSNMGGAAHLSACLSADKGAVGVSFAFHCSKSLDEQPVRKEIPLTRTILDRQFRGGRMLKSIGDCFEVVAGVCRNNRSGFLAYQCNKIATIEV